MISEQFLPGKINKYYLNNYKANNNMYYIKFLNLN